MKKSIQGLLLLSLILLSVGLQAQVLTSAASSAAVPSDVTMAKAIMSAETVEISIDADQPLQDSYEMDLSQFAFNSNEIATKYFGSISDNLVHYVPDFTTGKVMVKLQVANLGDKEWSAADWNTYLKDKATRYGKYLAGMNR